MAKVYDTATDLITFARSSSGTALRRVGYGDELVTNGTFDADTSGWSEARGNGVLSWDAGRAKVVADGAPDVVISQSISGLTVGALYVVTANIDSGTMGASARLRVSTDSLLPNDLQDGVTFSGGASGSDTLTFVATQTTHSVGLFGASEGAGETAYLDNISVKEVIFDRATDDLVLFDHPDDIPRIEYAADGSLKGLLIEEQRTNLVTYSEDFSQWNTFSGETSVTLSSDTIYGVSAYEVTGSTGGFGLGRLSPNGGASINLTSDGVLTFWAKKVTAGATLLYLWNGVVVSFDSQVPNDGQWHKVEITLAAANSQVQLLRGFTSGTVALAMPQLEAGSFATSYIPTSGSQSTRSPDIASIPVSSFGYNQSAGTVVVEAQTADTSVLNAADLRIKTPTGFVITNSGSRVGGFPAGSYVVWSPTTNILMRVDTVLGDGQSYKAAYSIAESNSALSVDGSSVVIDTTTTLAGPTASLFELGKGANFLNGHIKSLQYFPRRLTDAQLQELTA